jgi:hypothetical protein
LIGATTENPSFTINNALLSRAKVLVFEPLTEEDIVEFFEINKEKILNFQASNGFPLGSPLLRGEGAEGGRGVDEGTSEGQVGLAQNYE